ncbi:MAG: His/Gly/Thr/Pro-type tRNA ligase C-terminal domain-containing protein, partial [Chthonomonadales bacterium]
TKYSKAMRAQVQTDSGTSIDIEMGCYGLGISRTIASAIEAHHDDDGIIWPVAIAPFEVVLVVVNWKDEEQMAAGNRVYESLKAAGIDVIFDDREERSGVKFKDADLIGYPIKVVVGRDVAEGLAEVSVRRDKSNVQKVTIDSLPSVVASMIESEKSASI